MRRATLNFIIDLLGLTALIALTAAGAIIKWILPPCESCMGQAPASGVVEPEPMLMSMGRHDWGDVHFVVAGLFLFLVAAHVLLHWTWVKNYVKSIYGRTVSAPEEY